MHLIRCLAFLIDCVAASRFRFFASPRLLSDCLPVITTVWFSHRKSPQRTRSSQALVALLVTVLCTTTSPPGATDGQYVSKNSSRRSPTPKSIHNISTPPCVSPCFGAHVGGTPCHASPSYIRKFPSMPSLLATLPTSCAVQNGCDRSSTQCNNDCVFTSRAAPSGSNHITSGGMPRIAAWPPRASSAPRVTCFVSSRNRISASLSKSAWHLIEIK